MNLISSKIEVKRLSVSNVNIKNCYQKTTFILSCVDKWLNLSLPILTGSIVFCAVACFKSRQLHHEFDIFFGIPTIFIIGPWMLVST